jgi:2-polyprenyl-6-methoxyphenol hydroxylase-like FAD-dependent oxidoreductase
MLATANSQKTEVAIIGSGIIGLFNALQFAKRGIRVTIIDDFVGQKKSYKVGESLLVFSNAFLRTAGGLDKFLLAKAVPKLGVWFTYGLEGQTRFDNTTEWAIERTLPEWLEKGFADPLLYRAGVEDAQIVRPEAEEEMASQVRAHPNITFLDRAKVKDVNISQEGRPHEVIWESRSLNCSGRLKADWVIDCSGRVRLLAKKFGHQMEESEMEKDGFRTTAVWAQFSGIRKEMFGEAWSYQFSDGGDAKRDRCTSHLWGDGYWIWVINLAGGRISVGVTFNQKTPPPGASYEEQFWNVLNRYRVFDGVLAKENVLEFRVYKNVQHMTDTFASRHRYGLVGDAASIIDAYYSQGMSHSFLTAWHIANIVEEDLRHKNLNLEYIDRLNESLREDWRMVRNMVRGKFTLAIADSRFFLLTHLLDMVLFFAIGICKAQITRWLVETECSTEKELPVHRKIRKYLSKRFFYSQSFWPIPPRMLQAAQKYLQGVLTKRALWRIEKGIQVPQIKCIVRYNAGFIPFWRIFGKPQNARLDISPSAVRAVPPKFLRLTGKERFPPALKLAKFMTLGTFLALFFYDWIVTSRAQLGHMLRGIFGSTTSSSTATAPEFTAVKDE